MSQNPLNIPEKTPDKDQLKCLFEVHYELFEALLTLTSGFSHDWNYAKYSGWILKIADKRKALFYIIPNEGFFEISMAIREKEREVLMQDLNLNFMHKALKSAKKYREGYEVRINVTMVDKENIIHYINKLINLRSN